MVIITSPDVKLARINPIKIAKALNNIGKDLIKNVSKNNQGGITVHCYNAATSKSTHDHYAIRPVDRKHYLC